MSRQLSRAQVGVDASKADMVSGCMNGCVGFHKLLMSDYLGRDVSVAVSSMAGVVRSRCGWPVHVCACCEV